MRILRAAEQVAFRQATQWGQWTPHPEHVEDWDYPEGHKDEWKPGETAHFEYHCLMDPESSDYRLWQRTQQPVTVIGKSSHGEDFSAELPTGAERGEEGVPMSYDIRFADGHEDGAMEHELLTHPKYFSRQYAFIPENLGVQG